MDPSKNFFSNGRKYDLQSNEESFNLLPLHEHQNQMKKRPTKANATKMNENIKTKRDNKIIYDELKELIFIGDWELLLMKLGDDYPEFPIDYQDASDDNFSLLHHAAKKKAMDCLNVLLCEFLAHPDVQTDNGSTAIHMLVSSDCRCKPCVDKIHSCLEILLESGANVNLEDDLGETPLYRTARNRLSRAAEFLLSNGANINHWVNGTSVATLLAQYVPDVLKAVFDQYITIDNRKNGFRGLKLDFSLLLQEVACSEGLVENKLPPSSLQPSRKRKSVFPISRAHNRQQNMGGSNGKLGETLSKEKEQNKERFLASSKSSSSSSNTSLSLSQHQPEETELLNYLLMADLSVIDCVINHPLVEAFVHLKWLSVRKLFVVQRTFYLLLVSLYTFYIFDTFNNETCFYDTSTTTHTKLWNNRTSVIAAALAENNNPGSTDTSNNVTNTNENETETTITKGTYGTFVPTASETDTDKSREGPRIYQWDSFSEYFKAHEMICEPTLRTSIMAYLLAGYAVILVSYELYKMCKSWYEYFREPLSYAWWLLAFNLMVTVVPGMGFYAHTWLYPYAAFSLIFGWIMGLTQIRRIPYFGIFVGIFIKVLQDFCLLLFTFTPVLLAFAFGFSVMLPQNDFFQTIPLAFFKVFLMMTGDVDFWGVFKGTWTTTAHQGHVFIPLFLIYSVYVLMVTMVLMSLLLGLAVDNIQEVRHETALRRTVGTIKEIALFEGLFHNPALLLCGCAKKLRRLFSITSLKCMSGPELITYPEDPHDDTLPAEIKQKLVPYLLSSCCCSGDCLHNDAMSIHLDRRKWDRAVKGNGNDVKVKVGSQVADRRNRWISFRNKKLSEGGARNTYAKTYATNTNTERIGVSKVDPNENKSNETLRREFFENRETRSERRVDVSMNNPPNFHQLEHDIESTRKEMLERELLVYQEVKSLLEDNEKLRKRLEVFKSILINYRR